MTFGNRTALKPKETKQQQALSDAEFMRGYLEALGGIVPEEELGLSRDVKANQRGGMGYPSQAGYGGGSSEDGKGAGKMASAKPWYAGKTPVEIVRTLLQMIYPGQPDKINYFEKMMLPYSPMATPYYPQVEPLPNKLGKGGSVESDGKGGGLGDIWDKYLKPNLGMVAGLATGNPWIAAGAGLLSSAISQPRSTAATGTLGSTIDPDTQAAFNAWQQQALQGQVGGLTPEYYQQAMAQGRSDIMGQAGRAREQLASTQSQMGLLRGGQTAQGLAEIARGEQQATGALTTGLMAQDIAGRQQNQQVAAQAYLQQLQLELGAKQLGVNIAQLHEAQISGALGDIGQLIYNLTYKPQQQTLPAVPTFAAAPTPVASTPNNWAAYRAMLTGS